MSGPFADRDLRFCFNERDLAATGELQPHFRWQTARSMLLWFGAPLAPSLIVLAAAGLHWAALVVAGTFLLLVIYSVWTGQPPVAVPLEEREIQLRDQWLDLHTAEGGSRRHWSWFRSVELLPSWICLRRTETLQVLIPRRVMEDPAEQQELIAELRQRINRAQEASSRQVPLLVPDITRSSRQFLYSREQLEDLLKGRLELSPDDDPTPPRAGCRSAMLMLMLCTAVFVSVQPLPSTRRIVIWGAVCAAMWLPWLVWRLMTPYRIRSGLDEAAETLLKDARTHSIGPQGLVDRSALVEELYRWEQMTQLMEGKRFLFFCTERLFLATPLQALEDPAAFAAEAKGYFRRAKETEPVSDRETDPGPAIESGNPYQPPRPAGED